MSRKSNTAIHGHINGQQMVRRRIYAWLRTCGRRSLGAFTPYHAVKRLPLDCASLGA